MQLSQETCLRKCGTCVSAYAKSKFAVLKADSCHVATTSLDGEKMAKLKGTEGRGCGPSVFRANHACQDRQHVKMRLCGPTESPLIRRPPRPAPSVRPPPCASHRPRAGAWRYHPARAASLPSGRGSSVRASRARRSARDAHDHLAARSRLGGFREQRAPIVVPPPDDLRVVGYGPAHWAKSFSQGAQEAAAASGRHPYGSHATRSRRSSGVQLSQTKSSPSIAAPMDREDGISKTPGDSLVATKS